MRFLGRLLLIVVILIGGAIVALSFVDLGRFAPQIEAAAKKATGRDLKIEGPLHIGLSLTPSLVAEKVRFSNASWGSRPDMMTADKLAIKLDVIPLLSGKVALKSVELDGADIYVETDKSGKGNWEFGTAAPATSEPAKKGGGPALAGVPEVAISDLKLAYRAGNTQKVTKAEFKNVSIEPKGSGVHATVEGDVNGTTVAFDADVSQSGDDISFRNASLSVGGTGVKGDVNVNLAGTPTIKGALSNDKFDLTPLASGGGGGAKGGPIFSRDPLPLDQLNAANADLTLSVGQLTYGKVVLTNVKLPIKLQGGVLNVPASAAYRGAVLNLGITGNGGAKSLGLDLRAPALDIGKLFADLDVTDLLTAKADIAAKLSGRGNSLHAIAASAAGQTNVAVGQGTVNSKMFAIVSNDLAKAVIPSGESGNTAKLTCALSRFDFQGGVGTSKALAVETDSLITTGSGTVNLGTEKLDLVLKPKPKNASLASLAFPIRVSGPLNAPSAGIDREGAAIGLATAAGGIALTGGVGALLPLMSTGNAGSGTGGCASLAAKASESGGVVGGVKDAGEGVVKGVGGAVEGVTKGLGGLFGK
ncbi:MAG: AsmA family protein [Parvibaculum sp.]|uniref:AsmA family protein n=1 Tax=Parvibaculum sp. TaxID=2024848 RepID=UPI0025F9F05E|nr:AsmA family protein [Parvibaculum sp.]MCE9649000.1 AsmA family protein [Parvibaculum sp.]